MTGILFHRPFIDGLDGKCSMKETIQLPSSNQHDLKIHHKDEWSGWKPPFRGISQPCLMTPKGTPLFCEASTGSAPCFVRTSHVCQHGEGLGGLFRRMEWVIAIATRYHCAYVCNEADWPTGALDLIPGSPWDDRNLMAFLQIQKRDGVKLEHVDTCDCTCVSRFCHHGIITETFGGCFFFSLRYLGGVLFGSSHGFARWSSMLISIDILDLI